MGTGDLKVDELGLGELLLHSLMIALHAGASLPLRSGTRDGELALLIIQNVLYLLQHLPRAMDLHGSHFAMHWPRLLLVRHTRVHHASLTASFETFLSFFSSLKNRKVGEATRRLPSSAQAGLAYPGEGTRVEH